MLKTDLEERVNSFLVGRLSGHRLAHSRGVAETAMALATAYGVDPFRAKIAGLLHDCAREMRPDELLAAAEEYGLAVDPIERAEPLLLHGKVGAAMVAARFDLLDDPGILAAVALHITGAPGMDRLAQIVFLADFIEPGRTMPAAATVRALAFKGLHRALLVTFEAVIKYVVTEGYLLHPRTVAARNELLGMAEDL